MEGHDRSYQWLSTSPRLFELTHDLPSEISVGGRALGGTGGLCRQVDAVEASAHEVQSIRIHVAQRRGRGSD